MTKTIAAATAYLVLALVLGTAIAHAETPATAPAGGAKAPEVGAAERKILDDLEAAGEKHKTIRADVVYTVVNRELGDSGERTGWVAYDKGDDETPSRFRITFDHLKLGAGASRAEQVDYAFDGKWLTVAKHRIKNMTLYQVAAEGERVEPMRIGKGPFPMPFGQNADDVVKHFDVKTRPALSSDPKNTVYLRMTTRPEHAESMSVTRMELWIDAATHLPVKIRTRDKDKNSTTVTFDKTQSNKDVAASVFRIPRKLGWETVRRPLEGAGNIKPG